MNQSAIRSLCSCVVLAAVAIQAHAGTSLAGRGASLNSELEQSIRQRGAAAHKSIKQDAIKEITSKKWLEQQMQMSMNKPVPAVRITVVGNRESSGSQAD